MARILVIDDEKIVRLIIRDGLAGEGFAVEEAGSAAEAQSKIALSSPDLIVLDYHMPELDGTLFCRLLKDDPRTRDIPVILFTAEEEGESYESCGADGCVRKSQDLTKLIATIRFLLSGAEARHG